MTKYIWKTETNFYKMPNYREQKYIQLYENKVKNAEATVESLAKQLKQAKIDIKTAKQDLKLIQEKYK